MKFICVQFNTVFKYFIFIYLIAATFCVPGCHITSINPFFVSDIFFHMKFAVATDPTQTRDPLTASLLLQQLSNIDSSSENKEKSKKYKNKNQWLWKRTVWPQN